MNNNIISIDNSFVFNFIYDRKISKFFQKQSFWKKFYFIYCFLKKFFVRNYYFFLYIQILYNRRSVLVLEIFSRWLLLFKYKLYLSVI